MMFMCLCLHDFAWIASMEVVVEKEEERGSGFHEKPSFVHELMCCKCM